MKKIVFYYSFILALFITISGIITSKNTTSLLFQLLFIPITIYFTYSVIVQFIDKKSKPVLSNAFNRGALFFGILLFLLLIISSIMRVAKKPQIKTQKNPPSFKEIKISPRPKQNTSSYIRVKDEYKTDIINVRQSSSSASKIVGILNTKEKYQTISKKNQWFEIVFKEGLNGFVNERFVHPAALAE